MLRAFRISLILEAYVGQQMKWIWSKPPRLLVSSPYVDGRAGIVDICVFITETQVFLRNVFNTSSSVLSGFKTMRRSLVVLDPIKHMLRVF